MTQNPAESDDARLRTLLRESRGAPVLPPRFQENVWRRIEDAEYGRPAETTGSIEHLLTWVFRPRLALVTLSLLLVAGAWLGAHEGTRLARQDAQAHYLAAVAPNPLR